MGPDSSTDLVEQVIFVFDMSDHAEARIDLFHQVASGIMRGMMSVNGVVVKPGRKTIFLINDASRIGLTFSDKNIHTGGIFSS